MTTSITVVGGSSAVRFMTRSVTVKKATTNVAPRAADQAAFGLESKPAATHTPAAAAVGHNEPRSSSEKASLWAPGRGAGLLGRRVRCGGRAPLGHAAVR